MHGPLEEAADVLRPEAGPVDVGHSSIHEANVPLAPSVYSMLEGAHPHLWRTSIASFGPVAHCEVGVHNPILQTRTQLRKVKPLAQGPTAFKGQSWIQMQEARLIPKPTL